MIVIARERHMRALGVLADGIAFGVGCAWAAPIADTVARDCAVKIAGLKSGGLGLRGGLRATDGVGVDGEGEEEG